MGRGQRPRIGKIFDQHDVVSKEHVVADMLVYGSDLAGQEEPDTIVLREIEGDRLGRARQQSIRRRPFEIGRFQPKVGAVDRSLFAPTRPEDDDLVRPDMGACGIQH